MGRWKPLRVHGPSGRTPKDGIKTMIEGMKMMAHWHTDSFNGCPIGDGYEIEVNEFDFRKDNGICYEKDGVTIRHWRRSHVKDGASAYRLDWNGLSFVWTGDGRPEERSIEFSKGVDVFVTEVQPDTANLSAMKMGMPAVIGMTTIDQASRQGQKRSILYPPARSSSSSTRGIRMQLTRWQRRGFLCLHTFLTSQGMLSFLLPPIPYGLFKKNSQLPSAASAY
jgi:hypothetical protein